MSIHKALIEFHKRFHGATKTGFNPHFKRAHFTLEDVTKATTPILNELGLFVSHRVCNGELVTSVYDSDGAELSTAIPIAETTNPQALGSAITYFKRYNLCALLNIAEADDDGEAAAIHQPAGASMETLAELKDHLETMAGDLTAEQNAFFAAHPVDRMTEDQARKILNKLKQKEAA